METFNAPQTASASLITGSVDGLSVRAGVTEKLTPWVLSLGVLFVYLLFPTKNYYWDGIDFALVIEQSRGFGPALIHPHHLLYNAFGYLVYHTFSAVGWPVRAVHALQFANTFLSALSALLFYRFLRHAFRSSFMSAVLTLLFSFSSTWWKYSTDADAYVPCLFSLLISLNLLFVSDKAQPWSIALAHAVGMFMHQLAVFFYPVAVLGLLLHGRGLGLKHRLVLALKYSAAASLTTLAVNYYYFSLQTGSYGLADFAGWLTSYVQGSQGYSFSFDLRDIVVQTFRGHTRLFFEGRFNWLEGLIGPPILILLGVLTVSVSLLAWKFIRGRKRLISSFRVSAPLEGRVKSVAAACSLWACVYFAFLCFWYPYFTPYRLFYLPALITLLGVALHRYELLRSPGRRLFALTFVAAMSLSNFLFFIYPLSHMEKNPPLAMALRMGEAWPTGTVIFYAGRNADNELFNYFNPGTTWRQIASASGMISEEELRHVYRQGGGAWVDASALDLLQSSPDGSRWLAEHGREGQRAELVDGAHRIIFVRLIPPADAPATISPESTDSHR